ncbi:MAG: SwmB domain-containing protein, partial [Methylobacter sp.]|nr:SwmB domain-containing protein [Methylobacter sp.]
MTITAQQQKQVLQIGQAMFNAAPGANYLSEFSAYLSFGSSIADLAQSLSGTEAFLGKTYYDCVSTADFANAFVNELAGNHASAADKLWATNYIIDRMSAGLTQSGIISELTQALSAVHPDDASWGVAATQYNIRIATKIVDNLIGDSTSAAAKTDAIDYIVWGMANGKNTGQMIEWAITALDGADHADGVWGNAAVLFDNRIDVSHYYSVDKAGTAVDVGTLQQVLAPVTTNVGSIAIAKNQFESLLAGVAQDGYLAGATLFIDLNGDRVRSLDEVQVTTDSHGNFTFPSGAFGQIVATGGTDITTLLPFNGAFTAPAGATVVGPLTTLLQVFIEQGQGIATAELILAKALGADASRFDFIHFDPVPTALNVNASVGEQALGLQLRAAAAKVANLMVAAGRTLQGAAGGEDKLYLISAEQAVLKALANAINADSDGVINFSDQAMLRSILIDSATLLCHNSNMMAATGKIAAMASDFAAIMAVSATHIDNAIAAGGDIAAILVNIAQAEVVAQGIMSEQLLVAAETGNLSSLLPGFTDDAFDAKTDRAIIGDIDPNSSVDDAAIAASNAVAATLTPTPTDTTAPVMVSALVSTDGTKLVITYSEPLTGTAEAGDYGVTLSSGNLTSATSATIGTGIDANKVTLDLSLAILSTTTVSNLIYTATEGTPNSIKDAATVPNNAPTQTLSTVTNGSTLTAAPADTTPPTMLSAAVSADGTKLVITYSEPLTGTAEAGDYALTLSSGSATVTAAVIGTGANANKVTLTLSDTINSTTTVSNLAYDAAAGTANSIKDTATVPNNAPSQILATVVNSSTVTVVPTDTTPPVMVSAAVSADGNSLVITYSEPLTGSAEAGDYAFTLSSGAVTATAAAIGIGVNANKVTLTLSNTINSGVTVSNLVYNAEAGVVNSIKDAASPANNAVTQTLATVTNSSTVVSGGSTPILLTTSNDTAVGTEGNDTFNATYDGGIATDTLSAGDSVNGLGGIDTLNIDHFADVAITPPDSLWTGISNIEKVVLNTTGNGAQTITTGANFQAAFGANGVDFKTTTSGTGAITMNLSTFTGTAVLTTTSTAGAQVIVTGSGVTSVTAVSDAGALDIKGVGLATVIATTTGAGAQTIGDAGGSGANLTSVHATASSGTQTIISTSTANATVTALSSSGIQLITTGAGNDTITATSAAGTTNTISAGAGNDTIVAGLGNDLITGGTGADQMTGGGGVNTFAFGSNGSIIGTSMDIITDFNFGGADILTFGGATTVLAVDNTALVAGSNVQTTAGGVIVFHANDNTLALKIAAIQADIQLDVAGSIGMFVDSGNTYVYYAGTAAGNADDQLIQLSGVDTLVTIT